jgi:hypothetical protein
VVFIFAGESTELEPEDCPSYSPEDVGKRGIYMKFVAQSLTDELQEHCVTNCEDLPRSVKPFHMFSFCIIIGEEAWVFRCIAETKHQSMEC